MLVYSDQKDERIRVETVHEQVAIKGDLRVDRCALRDLELSGSNPRAWTLGIKPSGLNPRDRTRCARGVVMVRGEAWAAVSPTGVGTYLNV